ncbi:hypothetical protein BCAR13_440135 [Paraburkholderia caribensis]|nr:hypothetical protein BCAR13_440135 [Paraburkholderia caribensis]
MHRAPPDLSSIRGRWRVFQHFRRANMKPSEQFDYNFVIFADCVPAMLARFVVRVCYENSLM